MSGLPHYSERGIFARRGVLSPAAACRFRRAMQSSEGEAARVNRGGAPVVDPAHRRTRAIAMDETHVDEARRALDSVAAALARYLGEPLGPCQPPVFLAYSPGDYFRPHCDNAGDPRQPYHVRVRRVTVVLFLNGSAEVGDADGGDERFTGGELVLYRTMSVPTWADFYTLVSAETGMLVAFPADVFHEVAPVVAGRRYSIVTWFERSPALGG